MAGNSQLMQALSVGVDIDLSTWKVSFPDVELPPLAVDQVAPAGEFPEGVKLVSDALQANYSALNPTDTQDLVLNSLSFGDDNAPWAIGFRKAGQLVAAKPSQAVLKIVEFMGERALEFNGGAVVAMSDVEGVRYRMMLDLTSKRLRSVISGRMRAKTAFVDAKAVINVVIPVGLVGDTVLASGGVFDMVHNQSTPGDITINLPDQAVSTTVAYDVSVRVNIPASDFIARYAVIDTTIEVTRDGSGVFTTAAIVGDTTATGEAFPVVAADQRTFSDYKHTLEITAAANGSNGIVISTTVETENYTNVRAIDVTWSGGVALDGSGRLSADQKFDIWYNGADAGHTNWISTSSAAWRGYSLFETWMSMNIAGGVAASALDFKMFADNAGAKLVLKPTDLANNYSADFDKFALTLHESPGSNFAAVNWDGGVYPDCFVSAEVSAPATGYDSTTIRKKTQPFIIRLFLGLD